MSTDGEKSSHLTLCMVNYNGEHYLEESLGSVFSQPKKFYEILLIDNASEDRSLEIVRGQFPAVKIIQLDRNLGPATARNTGCKAASCDRILFMDNDVTLTAECPDQLNQALNDNPRAVAAMSRILYANKRNIIQYDGGDSHFLGLMTLHNVNRPLNVSTNVTKNIGTLVTTCFVLDRTKLIDGDLFDDTFFFNYEDHDFGLRARILGNEIVAVPSAYSYHREGTEGFSRRDGGDYSKVRVFCLIRNRWQIILKNYEFKTLLLLSPIFLIYEIFQFVGVIKKGWFGEWLKAFFWIILHSGEIFQKRRIVQKARKTPDREILRDGPIPFTKDLTKSPLERLGRHFLDRLAGTYWKLIAGFI